jgi:hypothetical protein
VTNINNNLEMIALTQNEMLKIRLFSSLEKVFADEELKSVQLDKGSMLSNETYSFQVAYYWDNHTLKNVQFKVVSELSPWITVRKVELVPSEMPCYADHDDNVLRTAPGLYPDPLAAINDDGLTLLPRQWRSLWITVSPDSKAEAGTYPIEVVFQANSGEELGKATYNLEVISAKLPKQSLIHTEWFHTDCLATWYKAEVFSEEYWHRVGQFVATAANNGINMLLTPIFTPPLDTQVGGERLTVQLVDVEKVGGNYKFGFDKLKRWIDLCLSEGIEYFEFSHLFTQWGAGHAPKIMCNVDGKQKRIFGWDTDASGEEYKEFLSQFLPELVNFIKQNGLEKQSYFHVSDEPSITHLESYKSASSIISEYLHEFPVIDALSDYKFYEEGIVKNPIPATNHIEPFLENKVPNLWTYYCCGQYKDVANRFFNMPSARNRIIGMQLYKFDIKGFLQWGYNFYNSQYSRYPINPYIVTDAGYGFPSGDAFVVYPGEEGPVESLRLKVFYEALQDLRALRLLEELIGREAVLEMLEEGLETPITFSQYPKESGWLLAKRDQINRKISELTK